jgi:hypothetical protein
MFPQIFTFIPLVLVVVTVVVVVVLLVVLVLTVVLQAVVVHTYCLLVSLTSLLSGPGSFSVIL